MDSEKNSQVPEAEKAYDNNQRLEAVSEFHEERENL